MFRRFTHRLTALTGVVLFVVFFVLRGGNDKSDDVKMQFIPQHHQHMSDLGVKRKNGANNPFGLDAREIQALDNQLPLDDFGEAKILHKNIDVPVVSIDKEATRDAHGRERSGPKPKHVPVVAAGSDKSSQLEPVHVPAVPPGKEAAGNDLKNNEGKLKQVDGPVMGTGKKAVIVNRHESYQGQFKVRPQLTVGECEGDCQRLSDVMQSWPKDKPRGAIYYLTKSDRLKQLKQSLMRLESGFNKQYQYPVIIFHEAELSRSLEAIRQYTAAQVFFQQVTFTIPTFLTEEVREDIACLSRVSYRHMCRFHAKLVYEYAIVHQVDYLWRLDDDSFILRPVGYDIFRYMYEQQLQYGYIWIHRDNRDCTAGLWNATAKFVKNKHLKPYFFDSWPEPQIYYNNFEISAVKIWTSPNYVEYIDYLDRLGGIFYHRWGDAPIKSLAVSLFVPQNRTHHFSDIGYQHTTFIN